MICDQNNISGNLQAALNMCQSLTVNELLEMAVYVGNKKESVKNREEWATAIASTLEMRCPNRIELN